MKKSFKFSFYFIFNVALILPLSAQTRKILSLESCITAAQENHPSVQAFQKLQESKAAATKSLQAQAYPGVDLALQGANYHYSDYRYNTLDNQLNLVWDMGKWVGKLKKLGVVAEDIAKLQARQNRLQLFYQVKQAYFNLVSARQEMHIARLSEIYLSHHLEVSQKLFKLGQIDRLDLYFTQFELAAAREKILAAQTEIDAWQIQLANLTGLTISSGDSLILGKLSMGQNFSADTLFPIVLSHNPAIFILNQQINTIQLQKKMVRNSRLPKIFVNGGYILDNDPTSGGDYAAISGGLSFPILDWGIRKNKAQTYQLESESLEATKQAFLVELRTNVQQIISRRNHFKKLLSLKEETMQQAQKTCDYTELNYQAGIATNTEVLLAQKALIAAKVSRQRVILGLYLIEAQIENLIGKL